MVTLEIQNHFMNVANSS